MLKKPEELYAHTAPIHTFRRVTVTNHKQQRWERLRLIVAAQKASRWITAQSFTKNKVKKVEV